MDAAIGDEPPGPAGLVETLLARAAGPDPDQVLATLAQLRGSLGGEAGPPADLADLVGLAEDVAARWRSQHDRRVACWASYTDAERVEKDTLATLHTALRALADEMAAGPAPHPPHLGADRGPAPPAPAAPQGPPAPAELEAHLLGPFRILRAGCPVGGWHGTKAPRVVRYLFAHAGRPVPREVLIDLFWPDAGVDAGRRGLHQAVYQIRRALRDRAGGPTLLAYRHDTYVVGGDGGVHSDLADFEARAEAGRRADQRGERDLAIDAYGEAERTYAGDLLEDSLCEEWTIHERERLRALYVAIANGLADLLLDYPTSSTCARTRPGSWAASPPTGRGTVGEALTITQRVLHREPADESAHRRAMCCHLVAGQRALCIRQFQQCAQTLDRLYGLGPDPETVELYRSAVDR